MHHEALSSMSALTRVSPLFLHKRSSGLLSFRSCLLFVSCLGPYPFCIYDTLRTCQVGGTNNITYVMSLSLRNPDLDYVNPEKEVYIGLWCLQAGATLFLSARLWAKLTRRHGLWWDDYILLLTWVRRLQQIAKKVAR